MNEETRELLTAILEATTAPYGQQRDDAVNAISGMLETLLQYKEVGQGFQAEWLRNELAEIAAGRGCGAQIRTEIAERAAARKAAAG